MATKAWAELVTLLAARGDNGARLNELPPQLRQAGLLTICDADRMIEFGRGQFWNHWTLRPGFKPIAEFLPEILAKPDDEMEHVRLTPAGHVEAVRLAMELATAEPATNATEGAKLEGNGDDDDEIDATYRAGGVATGEPLGTRFIGDVFRIEKTTITRKFHKRIADPRRKNAHLYSWDCVVKYFKANNQDAAEILAAWQRSDK